MKNRFAVPAAIALSAHALIFVGSGKPPAQPRLVDQSTKTTDDDSWKMQLKPEPMDFSAGGENGSDQSSAESPPVIPEIPPVNVPSGPEITQIYVHQESGDGTKIPTCNLGDPRIQGANKKALTPDMLDEKPRTRFQREPVYPYSMKVAGTSGTVWVDFMVDEKGHVHDVRVIKSTHPDFENATLTAVSQWQFEPGKRKGIPVRFRMSIPVVFNLTS